MDRWTQYLFERHSEQEVRQWAKRLKLFRYFRAYGGHANDGDSLDCAFFYRTTGELEEFFAFIGIELVRYNSRPPQPERGVSYPGDVFASFPSLIEGTAWLQQPGHCEISGNKVFVWCEAGIIKISATPGNYDVMSEDVAKSEVIETLLKGTTLEVIDPPRDTNHYVCPKYYPSYFS